jgi:hypothetical protein
MIDKYERVARIYPAVIGMLPTCVLLAICVGELFPKYQAIAGNVRWAMYIIGGAVSVSMAVGYIVREIFKETSKWLFQYPLFKKDETEMPTTKILLWQNSAISTAYHEQIATKVKETFGIRLPTREEEIEDPEMSKKIIVDVISQIRQSCRGDKILKQYNIEFGFCRNYLGACVWSILFIISIGVANVFYGWLSWCTVIAVLIAQLFLMIACYMLLETRGWIYAKYLLATFATSK